MIDMMYDDEDKGLILLNFLPSMNACENINTTLIWSKETLDFGTFSVMMGFYHKKKKNEEHSKAGVGLVYEVSRIEGQVQKNGMVNRGQSLESMLCARSVEKWTL